MVKADLESASPSLSSSPSGLPSPSLYESTLYSVLGNDFETLLCCPLLPGYRDKLWIYFRTMCQRSLDDFVAKYNQANRGECKDYPYPGTPASDTAEQQQLSDTRGALQFHEAYIFKVLSQAFAKDSVDLYNSAESSVILSHGKINEYITQVLSEIESPSELAFACHFASFFKSVSPEGFVDSDVVNGIVVKYIHLLIENRLIDLVAAYCSLLPDDLLVPSYCSLLIAVEHLEERKVAFDLGCRHFPRLMEEILSLTVETIMQRDDYDDAVKMKALEYLCLDPTYRFEGIVQANCLLRMLLLEGKTESCKLLVVKYFPSDSVSVIRELIESNEGELSESLAEGTESAIWEHESLVAMIIALTKFDLWRETAIKVEAEVEGDGSVNWGGAVGLNEAESEVLDKVKAKEARDATQRGVTLLEEAARGAVLALDAVLNCEDGFLFMSQEEEREDGQRAAEITNLRSLLLPNAVNLALHLHCVMGAFYSKLRRVDVDEQKGWASAAKEYFQQGIDLANTIANPGTRILECFSKDDVAGVLVRISEARVAVMRLEKDLEGS